MNSAAVPLDIAALLQPPAQGGDVFVTGLHARNLNDRAFGGQLLGQALWAAAQTVRDPVRRVHSLQAQFLRGARVDRPLRYAVESTLDGGRFSMRHVRATQDAQAVLDTQVSFQSPSDFPHEYQRNAMPQVPPPEELPNIAGIYERCAALGRPLPPGLITDFGAEMRPVRAEQLLLEPQEDARLLLWIKLRQRLPDDAPLLHQAALAFVSDYFINAATYTRFIPLSQLHRFYAASLSHALWFHTPARADDWLLFDSKGTRTHGGRGLCRMAIYDRSGVQVASAAQECLISERK